MEQTKDAASTPADFEHRLDENWNERKRLTEVEFELRSEIQLLLQQGNSGDQFQEARVRERECQAKLTRNNGEYDQLIEGWAAAALKVAK
jgi:hypothetical protein